MTRLAVPGLILSAAAAALLLYLLWDIYRRRGRLPALTYGGRTLRQGTLGWLWAGLLLGSLALSAVTGVPVASHARTDAQPVTGTSGELRASVHLTASLPFYRFRAIEARNDDGEGAAVVRTRVLEGQLQIPVLFLLAVGVYWLAVMRWPERREGAPAGRRGEVTAGGAGPGHV